MEEGKHRRTHGRKKRMNERGTTTGKKVDATKEGKKETGKTGKMKRS